MDSGTAWTLLAIAIVLLIFLGALVFVETARKGNRRFKWEQRARRQSKS